MGRALIGGLLRRARARNTFPSVRVSRAHGRASRLTSAFRPPPDNVAAVEAASVVVVAVKPQIAGSVLTPLDRCCESVRWLFRLRPASALRRSRGWCGAGVPVVRAMPNRPALVGAGATGLFAPASCLQCATRNCREGDAVGRRSCMGASEEHLDVVTALSGSGPAYFFFLAELMTQAATDLGLEPTAARRLAIATLHGAGQLAHAGDGDLAQMRAEVTSKGGTTEAAIKSFEAADSARDRGAGAGSGNRRSRELAEQFGAS